MTKKNITFIVLVTCVMPIYSCDESTYYERVPGQDIERALTPTFSFENNYTSSTESLPDRTPIFNDVHNQQKLIIQRKPLTRSEISWRATKYVISSLLCAGIGVGSYF